MEQGGIINHDIKKAPKTGEWGTDLPVVDKTKCSGCGTCAAFCPEATIEVKSQKLKVESRKTAIIDYTFCKGCGVCAEVCPLKAIEMRKKL